MPRFTIDVGDKFDAVLADLATSKETTKAEIIRRAVSLYWSLTNETEKDPKKFRICIVDDQDRVLKDFVTP